MTRRIAVAFQSTDRLLSLRTHQATVGLYRSLLCTARQFNKPSHRRFLQDTIRERFHFHQHETSRPLVLRLLAEGDKALQLMQEAQSGNDHYMAQIDAMASAQIGPLAHVVQKMKKIPHTLKRALVATDIRSHASRGRSPSRGLVLPTDLCDLARIRQPLPLTKKAKREYLAMIYKKKRCLVKARKPYQVLMRTRTALGVPFLRVRGFRQPLQVSMMLKDRVKTNQKQVYRCQELVEQIAMMEQEDKFLKQLKVPSDAEEFASPLRQILQDYASKYALRNEQLDFINQQRTKNRVIK